MKLRDAKFCYNCDEVFDTDTCPACGRDDNWVWLSSWITAIINTNEPNFSNQNAEEEIGSTLVS